MFYRQFNVFIIVFGIFVFYMSDLCPAKADSADDTLTSALHATQWVTNASFNYVYSDVRTGLHDSKIAKQRVEEKGTIYRNDKNLRVKSSYSIDGAKPIANEFLLTPSESIAWAEGELVEVDRAHKTSLNRKGPFFASPRWTWALDATFVIDSRIQIFDLFAAQQIGNCTLLGSEVISGLTCKRIKSVGDGWFLDVWICPERGFNVAKLIFYVKPDKAKERLGRNVYMDQFIHERLPNGMWYVESAHFYSDIFVDLDYSTRFWTMATLSRANIIIRPSFEKLHAFDVPKLPNGTKAVLFEDGKDGKRIPSALLYVWQDGKLAPAYDENVVEHLKKRIENEKGVSH